MRTPRLTRAKLPFRTFEGGRTNQDFDELESQRADAVFYRSQTLAIVRHFFEVSCQIGRLPSILGREFFRARVTHHAIPSFEDQALFVYDVERAIGRLNERDAEVIALVGLFHYSLDEAATVLGRPRSTVYDRFSGSVDRLAELFLEAGLLKEERPDRRLRRFPPADAAGLPPKKPPLSVRATSAALVAQN
jgi:hypothetical protein